MDFQIRAMAPEPFARLFAMDAAELARHNAVRVTADCAPGYPCRVSLDDAPVGATLVLVNHRHLPAASPYQASHAIYVSEGARMARPQPNEVPPALRRRLLSLRAFDAAAMMLDADVAKGDEAADRIAGMLRDQRVTAVHIHFAKAGCFAAQAERA